MPGEKHIYIYICRERERDIYIVYIYINAYLSLGFNNASQDPFELLGSGVSAPWEEPLGLQPPRLFKCMKSLQ